MAWHPTPTQWFVLHRLVFLLVCLPMMRLVLLAYRDALGANPIEALTRATGWWSLVFLLITLLVTPLRRVLQWPWLLRMRRTLGLSAFFYALAHFITFIWFDHWFDQRFRSDCRWWRRCSQCRQSSGVATMSNRH